MIQYEKRYKIVPDWRNKEWVMEKAHKAMKDPVFHITDVPRPRSEG